MKEQNDRSTPLQHLVLSLMREGEQAKQTAVALYGTSAGVLREILTTGVISSFPEGDMVTYQKELVASGGYLYYALPYFDRFERIQPEVSATIRKRYQHLDPNKELSPQKVRKTAQMYALEKSLTDSLSQSVGQRVDNYTVHYLAGRLLPKLFAEFSKETISYNSLAFEDLDVLSSNAESTVAKSLLRRFSHRQLEGFIRESIQQRGVILYFSEVLFQGNTVLAGKETEGEIMVLAKTPLSASVIAGIEFLSDFDVQSVLHGS